MRAGAQEAVGEAARLAVSEAVSNVVVHSYRDASPGAFTLSVEWNGDELRVTVRDKGCGMAPRMDSPGAGLGLLTTHRWTIEPLALRRRLPAGTRLWKGHRTCEAVASSVSQSWRMGLRRAAPQR